MTVAIRNQVKIITIYLSFSIFAPNIFHSIPMLCALLFNAKAKAKVTKTTEKKIAFSVAQFYTFFLSLSLSLFLSLSGR